MYSLFGYGQMVSDSLRVEAYAEALRKFINPDSVVLDIGTGFGFFAVLACQLGARKVIAIEPDNVIEIARQVAARNHCGDKIQFIQDVSFRVTLAERADIIISDLRGLLPWFQKHVPAIMDARKRLLAAQGRLIPASDLVWAALVESDELYSQYVNPWCSKPEGVDLSVARQFAVNQWTKGQKISPSQFLGQPQMWAKLDYSSIDGVNVSATISWTIGRRGTAHGILLWFDTVLCDDIGFSNCPTDPQLIYGNVFFPFSDSIQIDCGETITVRLQATLVGEDYIWVWNTVVSSDDRLQLELKQSTFLGSPLLREQVARRAENYVADLDEDGLIDRTALDLIDGKKTLAEISARLLERFPARFSNMQEALTRVGELSVRYSGTRRPT